MFSEGNKEVIIKHSRKYLKLFECGKLAFGRKSLKHILCKAVYTVTILDFGTSKQ